MKQPQSSPWWRQWICSVLLRHRDSGPGRPVGDLEWSPGRVRCKRCGCTYVWARGKGPKAASADGSTATKESA